LCPSALPREIPVTTIGLGSNLIVRDARSGAGWVGAGPGTVETVESSRCRLAAALGPLCAGGRNCRRRRFALRGVPGSIGGGLANAGAHGGEIKDVLVKRGSTDGRQARFCERRWAFLIAIAAPDDVTFTSVHFRAAPASPRRSAEMSGSLARERPNRSARRLRLNLQEPTRIEGMELIDKAGCWGCLMTPRCRPCT
jgi:UDP-N-acetylmuramate dehydrogenase